VREDAEGGVNAFIEQQATEPGEALLTLVQFDMEYEFLHKGVPISQVPKYKLVPRGMTALLDAIGRAINETGERLAKMAEQDRPGLVVFVVMTDGQENSSKEFSKADIKAMIQRQQDTYKWHFTFLGANQDAFAEAGEMGIAAGVWPILQWTRWRLPTRSQEERFPACVSSVEPMRRLATSSPTKNAGRWSDVAWLVGMPRGLHIGDRVDVCPRPKLAGFEGCTVIKANRIEAAEALGCHAGYPAGMPRRGHARRAWPLVGGRYDGCPRFRSRPATSVGPGTRSWRRWAWRWPGAERLVMGVAERFKWQRSRSARRVLRPWLPLSSRMST